jgi:hypothetical protein
MDKRSFEGITASLSPAAPPTEEDIDDVKSAILAKLALSVGKDPSSATDREPPLPDHVKTLGQILADGVVARRSRPGHETSSRAHDAGPTGGSNHYRHHARDPLAATLGPTLVAFLPYA